MFEGQFVFTQLMNELPWHTFDRCVVRYDAHHKVKSFRCSHQFRCLAIAQLLQLESLREIEICLRAHTDKLYHLGLPAGVARNTLANANQVRSWQLYADFAPRLICIAQPLYSKDDFQLQLDETVYALDSSTVDLCLSLFPWAAFRTHKAGIKIHTLLNLQGNIPSFIEITEAKLHDVNILDQLVFQPGDICVMDRAYLDFERLYQMECQGSYFVVRSKSNTQWRRLYTHKVDRTDGLICDQTIVLTGTQTAKRYPSRLRRIKYVDRARKKNLGVPH